MKKRSVLLGGALALVTWLLLMLPLLCRKPTPPLPIHNPIDSITNVALRRADSLLASANIIDSLKALLRERATTTIITTTKWIEIYRSDTNLLRRLQACDSIASGAEILAVEFITMDSMHQHTESDLRMRGDLLAVALDTARNYSVAQTATINDLNAKISKKERQLKRTRRIAAIAASVAIAESAVLFFLLKP